MSELSNKKNISKGRLIAVLIICLLNTFIVTSMPTSSTSFFLPQIAQELGLSPTQSTSFSAGVNMGTFLTVFIAGMLLDKLSTRKLMMINTIVAALVVAGRAWAPDYRYLYLMFVLYGVTSATLYQGANKVVALWYEKKHTFVINALLIGSGAFSYIVGLNVTRPIAEALGGWREYYQALAIVMAIIGFCWVIVVPERSSKDAVLNEDVGVKNIEQDSVLQNIKHVLSSPRAWCCFLGEAGFGGCIQLVINLTAFVLVNSWGLEQQQAATLQSWSNTGSLIGYIILPTLMMKYWKKDQITLVGMSMVVSPVLWMIAIVSKNTTLMPILYAIGGFFNGFGYTGPRTFLMQLPEVAGLRAGTALGAFNTINKLGATIWLTLAGILFNYMSYDIALAIMFASGFIGAAAMFMLKYLNKKYEEQDNLTSRQALQAE